jgi:hypothetical protein
MATTITIAYEVPGSKFAAIEALAAEQVLRNIDWCGETINVKRGDFTEIDGAIDQSAANRLHNRVLDIISGEQD